MAIADDLVGHAHIAYLGDPFEQYCGLNGKPLIGGWIEVYQAGTDTRYITMQNFDGAMNPFKVPLNSDGRVVMLADPSLTYDMYVRNSYGDLVCSRLNVECTCPGNISIKGLDTWVRNTDGTLDVSLQTSANNRRVFTVNTHNKILDCQSPLYFVENSETATVIGFSGDDFASKEYVDSAISSKLDTTAFSNVSGDFLTDKFEYDDNSNITGYNGSAFAGGGSGPDYEAGDHIAITDNVISVTGLPDSADLENAISSAVTNVENKFEYNENNYITAYNNSAFAGKEYSAGDYVSIENNTISVTGLQPAGDYATKTELESATSGKMDVTGMTAYQPTGDYATHDDLTAYQPVGDYYSASNPSGFITNDAITGLQPSGDYATHDDLTAYATTALVSSVSSELYSAISGISGDYELVAGSGVELVDDPNEKTTTINVTAEGTPVTAIEQMIDSATSGLQPSGDYATTAQVADKLDTTAFSDVSGSFLTGIPDTYLQNTDLSTEDGKVTAISGIPLSAGGEVPEGVMVESGLEYNAVQEISGYNGSAIAQYGAEKQWLVHDDTLVHAANSAQYALGVNLSAVAQLLGIDETLLWEGDAYTTAHSGQMSESPNNFRILRTVTLPDRNTIGQRPAQINDFDLNWNSAGSGNLFAQWQTQMIGSNAYTGQTWYLSALNSGTYFKLMAGINQSNATVTTGLTSYQGSLRKIIGIGRRS